MKNIRARREALSQTGVRPWGSRMLNWITGHELTSLYLLKDAKRIRNGVWFRTYLSLVARSYPQLDGAVDARATLPTPNALASRPIRECRPEPCELCASLLLDLNREWQSQILPSARYHEGLRSTGNCPERRQGSGDRRFRVHHYFDNIQYPARYAHSISRLEVRVDSGNGHCGSLVGELYIRACACQQGRCQVQNHCLVEQSSHDERRHLSPRHYIVRTDKSVDWFRSRRLCFPHKTAG